MAYTKMKKLKNFFEYENDYLVYEKRQVKKGDKVCEEVIGGNFIMWPTGSKKDDQKDPRSSSGLKPYTENFDSDEDYDDTDVHIKHEKGVYVINVLIPKTLLKHLVGIKGRVKKEIEINSGATLVVPMKGQYGPVVIKSSSRKAVMKCKNQVDLIVLKARHEQPFTHFLSIPMTSHDIKENFKKFKAAVLEHQTVRNRLSEGLFMNPNKLHLTIGTLVLNTEDEIINVQIIMERFKREVLVPILCKSTKLEIIMNGLEYMNDDPSEVRVLYAKVELKLNGDDILQQFSDKLVSYFVEDGLMLPQYDRVKLHVTLMNSKFRRDRHGFTSNTENELSEEFESKSRDSFDVTTIMEKFSDFYFGKQTFETIHLSIRHSTDNVGYYKCQFDIDFKNCYS